MELKLDARILLVLEVCEVSIRVKDKIVIAIYLKQIDAKVFKHVEVLAIEVVNKVDTENEA